jgi:uncharacterized damage-inducible protein DinB
MKKANSNRRSFFKKSSVLIAGLVASPIIDLAAAETVQSTESLYLVGPRDGYTPKIGTLLSTMTFMRAWIIQNVEDLSVEELDFQFDDKSNSIGALLMHLASVERFFQLNTFDEIEWGAWDDSVKQEWDVAKNLGKVARSQIKGHDADYYLSKLAELRSVTETEFAKRDDDWLLITTPFFKKQPTNNHCKWFHATEHESNHNGQISLIKKRFPA